MANQTFTPIILSGIKQVLFTPWGSEDSLDLTNDNRYDLQHLVGDTVSITQDDNTTEEISCETRDEPLYESITLGKYQVTMESGDISHDLLKVCLGYHVDATNKVAFAPASYTKRYAHIEVVMQESSFVIPRVLLSSRLDASSLKSGIARGIVGGTAYSVDATVGSGKIATPFFVVAKDGTAPTISLLGKGTGSYVEFEDVNSGE